MIDEGVIRQLADPMRYPGRATMVTQYQTHLSLVCAVGDRAYKLKKSLQLPFVDVSTRAKRRWFCEEEVRLNARLCPDTYLGVVPLFARAGEVSFCDDGAGEIIDYAVLMRRLPAQRMMDALLLRDAVTRPDVERIATLMANFHRDVALAGDSEDAQRSADRLCEFALANFEETAGYCESTFDLDLHRALQVRAVQDFDQHLPQLRRRAQRGLVVDGHGDLHAGNICLCEPMAIYDCIEFSHDLRVADVAAENAFLAMDLRYRAHPELGAAYLDQYISVSGDDGQRDLIPMLLRHRAMVRAKVAVIASGEAEIDAGERDGCISSARRHLNLIAASAIEHERPWLICACGLPATGKSFVFDALARTTGWPSFASDRIRKELAGIGSTQRAPENCYTRDASARTYAEAIRRAGEALRDGPVLLDANFGEPALRELASACARNAGARMAFVWFQADDHEIEHRMRQRAEDPAQVSDADLEVYRMLKGSFQPPCAEEADKLIIARVDVGLDQRVAAILRQLI